MIEEILLRLPFSSVFGSRCVSKPWLSLTTSPYFIRRWELHHRRDPPLGLLLQDSYSCSQREFFLCPGAPRIKFSGFSLDFLSGFRFITVMGSCEDLLLCCNRALFQTDYFVVNPITRQWVALPPTLRLHKSVITGFVCDPTSIPEARNGGDLRYRVVRIPVFKQSKTEFNVEIFSSEDGQWNEYAMTWAEGLATDWWKTSGVACNGILYWQFKMGGAKAMGLDPFNPKKKGIRVIYLGPQGFYVGPSEYTLGICQGKLRMGHLLWSSEREVLQMNIWELEKEEVKWRLVQVVPLQEIVAANSSIVHPKNVFRTSLMPLAFHPNDGDIIYFKCSKMKRVICCNSKRMSFEIVRGYYLSQSFARCAEAFPFPVPWLPTPVLALPKPGI